MKFRAIFRYEFKYQFQHVYSWFLIVAFLLFGFLILRMVTLPDGTHLNAPGTIAFFAIFAGTIWLLIGGGVAGDAATRDIQHRTHPLIYTTPVSKGSYLGARFLAALALNITILTALYAGMFLSFYGPGAKSAFLGPFRATSYLTAYAFITLPTVIAVTAVQFAFASYTGRAIAAFIGSILLLFVSHFLGTIFRYNLGWQVVGSLLDLLSIGIVADMEGWTPIDKNTRLISLHGMWLWNRMMWCGIGVGALVFTYVHFELAHLAGIKRWRVFRRKKEHRLSEPIGPERVVLTQRNNVIHMNIPVTPRNFGGTTHVRQVLAIVFTSFSMIARSRGGLTLIAIIAIGTGVVATEYMEWLGVPLFARTEEVLRTLTPSLSDFKSQWIIIPILIIFYAGELVWREREAGLHELSDAAPVRDWVMFLGKYTGLVLVIITWVLFLMVAGIINQLVMDNHHFELGVYLKVLFGIQLTNYILFALLVFVIHVLVNRKYIGHIVAFGAYGFIMFASRIGIEHHMLIYASDPGWSYSDMRGFGPFMKPWLWFKFYWASWAFVLAVIATLFRVRSKERGFRLRLSLARNRFSKYKTALVTGMALVGVSGGFIFYNTNVLNTYVTKDDHLKIRARYEQRYGKYEYATLPALVRTKLNVEIYPDEQAADIKGTYHLVNLGKVPIKTIHLSSIPQLPFTAISFDRRASSEVLDNDLGFRVYSLERWLEPGDSLQMNFEIQIKPRGFSNNGVDASIVGNGSHFTSALMPIIGYHGDRRLRDARDRVKFGLVPRAERPTLNDLLSRYDARHAQPMDFEAVVGTTRDQVAIAPGALQRTWTRGERKYFHYVTQAPINNSYGFFSAGYAMREVKWSPRTKADAHDRDFLVSPRSGPVTIQIFFHPTHHANIDRMLRSVQASLDYYSREFGPYPHSQFRVLERPGPGRGMHAEPMTIDFQEGYSLMNPAPQGHDLPYHIMAHEVAHQWWGLQFAPAAVEGIGLLVESLATYSAMQVVEKNLGYEHLLRYLSQMRLEYEVPRSRAAPPLLRSNNAFMHYRKGPFALFALRNYIGKDRVNDALRAMLQKYSSTPPLPTTLDFYRELQAVTPDSLRYLVHDLFAANTFWEMKTESATTKQTKPGTWQVTLEVEARKVTVDSIGIETNVPMNDWIEIGVYPAQAENGSSAKALYLKKHRVSTGRQTILLTLSKQPGRAGIDPNHLLIDLNMHNNTRNVTVQ